MASGSKLESDQLSQVLSAISTAQWTTTTPNDQEALYKSRAIRSTRIQTFGPTAASDQVLMQARLTANLEAKPVIQARATHRLSQWGQRLMTELSDRQISWRSRPAGVMSNRLQLNEITRRVTNARKNMDLLDSISLPDNIAEELLSIKKNALMKRLTLSTDTLTKYVKEHEDSSIVPRVKWGMLPEPSEDMAFWKKFYDNVKANFDNHIWTEAFNTPFNFGSRQRVPDDVERDKIHYDLEIDRTRIVMFTPSLSSVFAFVPDKVGFYQEVIEGALDLFEINDHFLTPMTHGGEVYGTASEALRNGDNAVICLGDDVNVFRNGVQYAFDGVNWETQVGTILGAPFHGTKTYFGGMYHVPSGVFDTSLDDTLASMWVYSQNDDMKKGIGMPGVMEREEMDEDVNFMLGLAYNYDPEMPRLQGLKLTQDKADAAVPLPSGRNLELTAKWKEDEAERWYLGYHGTTPTGGTLLDFLEKIKPEDFRGGEVSDLVSQGADAMT